MAKSPVRLATGVVAVGLIIWALILMFSSGTATAYIKTEQVIGDNGNPSYNEDDRDIDCHTILNSNGLDWPLDEDGARAESTALSNRPILDGACGAQRTERLGWVVLILVPGVGLAAVAASGMRTRGTTTV